MSQFWLAAVSLAVIYVVESGLPLPIPEDVFVLYLGYYTGFSPMLALTGVVIIVVATAGSLNLYFLSRKLGPRILASRLAAVLRLTPERVARIERWFARWGAVAVVFGRYLPGPPIAITVAAGVFRLRLTIFVASVAISVGIWVAAELMIGASLGRAAVKLVEHNLSVWTVIWLVVALVGAGVLLMLVRQLFRRLELSGWFKRHLPQALREQL